MKRVTTKNILSDSSIRQAFAPSLRDKGVGGPKHAPNSPGTRKVGRKGVTGHRLDKGLGQQNIRIEHT